MKNTFLDKLLHRIDRVGSDDLQNYLQQLAREKGFLETVFNTLQEGIVVIDPEGRILYLNHAVEDLLGLPGEEALQQPISRYLRGIPWASLLAEKQILNRDLEVTYPLRRQLNLSCVPLDASDHGQGRPRKGPPAGGFVLIFRDLTLAREETRETIESEKLGALTLLAAGVAHELGNPLNSLNIHLQLLERDLRRLDAFKSPATKESWQVLQSEIARLDTIIANFLRAVRPTSPQLKPENLNALLEESVAFLKPEIDDRDMLVEIDLDPGAPALLIDRDQIKQAFYNLIKNGVQAMRTGGILRIVSERDDTHLILSFIDNGSGISPDRITRIFEPYYTTKASGTGLGLLIVRRIVRDHGGEMQIESHEGRGTTVRILLPLPERRVRLLTAGSPDGGAPASDIQAKK
ncbi:PAS domain S-box-containing protein [Verrucomicrobium sp. GAS474]|uniref:two-component system sensor histidine kinase NtrB n=1 Tax=Verrucomicrobium sp. GAS474 TaxID=1882831 RepID=UPI00087BCAA2|nr:ATP-binding protein [Verrucomicrobium sp. GAS474]SDU21762.1 PAS domain S-box-containing protein [Verrucomicrobium sp. GAS474]